MKATKNNIPLETVTNLNERHLAYIGGKLPYLWIGDRHECFGVIPPDAVETLRDMCDRILKRKKK